MANVLHEREEILSLLTRCVGKIIEEDAADAA